MIFRIFLLLLASAGIARADLFVAGFSSNAVYRYNENDGSLIGAGPFISTGAGLTALNQPHRVFITADGNLLVANAGRDTVQRYNGSTGALIGTFITAGSGGLDYPVDMTLGPDGALYVSSQLSDSILRYDASTGAFIDEFVSVGSGGLDAPSGIVFHNGELFVAGRTSNRIHRYDSNGDPVGSGVFAGPFPSSVFGLDFGADGNLYAVTGNSVMRFDPNGVIAPATVVTTGSGGLNGAIGLDFGPNNGLYVASLNTDQVIKYDTSSSYAPTTFVTAGLGGIDAPNFLTFGSVPEPSVAVNSLLGAVVLFGHRLRRRIPA